ALVVRPVLWASRRVLWLLVDDRLLDGLLVNGTAKVSRALGWVGSRLQTGQLGMYVAIFVIGVLALLSAMAR
ncbi:MAG: hypothetical protein ACREMR_10160, partial [Gemmatimonadales bacterium]